MAKETMQVKIEGKTLVIRIPLQNPTPSASGKTLVCATTRGNIATDAKINSKPLIVGLNAYIRQ